MYSKQIDRSMMRQEYGVLVCRLLDHLPKDISTSFGTAIIEVEPLGAVDLHSHHEHELWVLISGKGIFEAGGLTTPASGSTLFYMKPHQEHSIKNTDPEVILKFLSIWWN